MNINQMRTEERERFRIHYLPGPHNTGVPEPT